MRITRGGLLKSSDAAGAYVALAGAQTITGAKDFTTAPTVNGQPIAAAAEVVSAGNLGATYTLDLSSRTADVLLRGTLNANHTLTLTNATAGDHVVLLLTQDATGGRTLTLSFGAGSQSVTVDTAASATSVVTLDYDGTDLFVSGGVGLSPTVVDAKGDLLAGTAADTIARLAVGANGTVLRANSATATGLEWASASGLTVGQTQQNYVHSGEYHSPNAATSTGARPQGLLEAAPIYLPACTLDRLRTNITTAGGVGATVRLGIYSDDGTGRPGTLLIDGGTVASDTTGLKEVTISQVVTAGLYWLAAVSQDSATVPTRQTVSPSAAKVAPLPRNGSTGWYTGYAASTTHNTGALPSTLSTLSLSGAGPFVDVRVA